MMWKSRPRWLQDKWLFVVLAWALLLRVVFIMVGASIYYGRGQEHYNGDSFSFINSFLNLWQRGSYTLEPLIPDASFGRLPGYPFFYGLHYILFGTGGATVALTVTQTILDVGTVLLLYRLIFRLTERIWAARIVAILYATYPFAIIWVTIIGTETLNSFFTVVWLSLLTSSRPGRRGYILIGLVVASTFYVRVYMGILLPISMLYVWFWPQNDITPKWQRTALIIAGFGMLYIWWPVRNYVFHQRIILTKPASAGYANQRDDMQAYLDWLHAWTNDNTTWMEAMIQNTAFHYPKRIFSGLKEERRAYDLTAMAARCGSSFHLRRLDTHDYSVVLPDKFHNCNAQIAAGFDSLRISYVNRHPVRYWTEVPLLNLRKAFFKYNLTRSENSFFKHLLIRVLFIYRSLLLLIGIVGLLVGWRQTYLWPLAAYFLFIYLYICFDFRSLEMRYLLQADILLLLPAAWVVDQLLQKLGMKKKQVLAADRRNLKLV